MDTVPVHYTEGLYEVDDLSLHFKPEDWLVLPGGGREREGDTESGARLHPESRVFPSAFCLQGFCFASSQYYNLPPG